MQSDGPFVCHRHLVHCQIFVAMQIILYFTTGHSVGPQGIIFAKCKVLYRCCCKDYFFQHLGSLPNFLKECRMGDVNVKIVFKFFSLAAATQPANITILCVSMVTQSPLVEVYVGTLVFQGAPHIKHSVCNHMSARADWNYVQVSKAGDAQACGCSSEYNLWSQGLCWLCLY